MTAATTMTAARMHRRSDGCSRSNRNRNTSTVTLGRPLATKFILLAIWLVINQCVSIALSEPSARQPLPDNNNIEDTANGRSDDLDELLRVHRIIGDDAADADEASYVLEFVVHVRDGEDADRIAADHGFVNVDEVSLCARFFDRTPHFIGLL